MFQLNSRTKYQVVPTSLVTVYNTSQIVTATILISLFISSPLQSLTFSWVDFSCFLKAIELFLALFGIFDNLWLIFDGLLPVVASSWHHLQSFMLFTFLISFNSMTLTHSYYETLIPQDHCAATLWHKNNTTSMVNVQISNTSVRLVFSM